MELIRHLPIRSERARAIAIGNFDGLHLGHQAVIAAMTEIAAARTLTPSLLTFEPHPRRFFSPAAPGFRIMRLSEKLTTLKQLGVESVAMPRFNAAFATMPAETFLSSVLGEQLGAQAVITGENFAFGHKRGGDITMLKTWGAQNNVHIITVPPVAIHGSVCSSSAVRTAIIAGDMALATTLLGRDYTLTGRITHGQARGRQLGFPTANIPLPTDLLLPPYGVYAVRATLDGTTYNSVANLGIRPTIGDITRPVLEVHLFDFAADIYNKRMHVSLIAAIRPEMKFNGLDALRAQIASDCEAARTILES